MIYVENDIQTKTCKIKLSDIIFREDIYARIDKDQALISKYAENAESIVNSANRILISQDNILIDGWHRWKAFERVYGKDFELDVDMFLTDNTDLIELESYAANQKHGKANSKKDAFRNIQRLYAKGHDRDVIQRKLSISKSWVNEATKQQRAAEDEERNRVAVEMYLRAGSTYESIAEELGVTEGTIRNIVKERKMTTTGQITETWNLNSNHDNYDKTKPFRYNIWNLSKQDNQNDAHFGSFPQRFMENLLWYYTEPLDIVFDPFAGGGTTIDACKVMFRRYYCTDIRVIPGRENDIIHHDITTGLPDDLPKPNLVFLDPPYWKQAQGDYTELPSDLSNMSIDKFYETFAELFNLFYDKMVTCGYLAFIIQNTQWKNEDKHVEPHSHVMWNLAEAAGFQFEHLIQVPYSTQQYNAQMVEYAKEHKIILQLNRELVVMRKP